VIVPIDDAAIRNRLSGILDDALRDEANSWELQPDGRWSRVASTGDDLGFSLQDHLQGAALAALGHHEVGARPDLSPTPALLSPAPSGPTSDVGPRRGPPPGSPASRKSSRDPRSPRWRRWLRPRSR
jgi:hypothetical protein